MYMPLKLKFVYVNKYESSVCNYTAIVVRISNCIIYYYKNNNIFNFNTMKVDRRVGISTKIILKFIIFDSMEYTGFTIKRTIISIIHHESGEES